MPILTKGKIPGGFGGGSAARPQSRPRPTGGLFGTINAVNQTPWGQPNGFAGTRSEGGPLDRNNSGGLFGTINAVNQTPWGQGGQQSGGLMGQFGGGGSGLMQTMGGDSSDPRWSHNGGSWNSGGSPYGGGLMGQIGSAQATQGAQNYRGGTNQPSWGGGNVMGGMAQGQTQGTFTNAQGQTQSTLNGGARTMGSVNWGAVAGIQNYLNTINPAQRAQAEQYLASQGLMPSYNGMSLPQSQQMASTQGMGQLGGQGSPYLGGMSSAAGNNGYLAQQHQNWVNDFTHQNTDGSGNAMLQAVAGPNGTTQYLDSTGAGYSGTSGGQTYSNGRLVGPAGGGGFGGAGGSGGFGGGGGGGGEYGGATFPLEGAMQDQIMGVLNNPSPYSQQQTQMMRNRSTAGIDQQRMEAQRQAGADAARRGLSPQEAAANQSALGASYDRTRQGVQQDFELNNALASRQGLMQGLGAGQGLLGSQMQNEDSIRRYLAMLGQTQAGNPPQFVQSL